MIIYFNIPNTVYECITLPIEKSLQLLVGLMYSWIVFAPPIPYVGEQQHRTFSAVKYINNSHFFLNKGGFAGQQKYDICASLTRHSSSDYLSEVGQKQCEVLINNMAVSYLTLLIGLLIVITVVRQIVLVEKAIYYVFGIPSRIFSTFRKAENGEENRLTSFRILQVQSELTSQIIFCHSKTPSEKIENLKFLYNIRHFQTISSLKRQTPSINYKLLKKIER